MNMGFDEYAREDQLNQRTLLGNNRKKRVPITQARIDTGLKKVANPKIAFGVSLPEGVRTNDN